MRILLLALAAGGEEKRRYGCIKLYSVLRSGYSENTNQVLALLPLYQQQYLYDIFQFCLTSHYDNVVVTSSQSSTCFQQLEPKR